MDCFIRRLLTIGLPMWNLFLSTAGCFVLMRGFRLVTTGKEAPDTASLRVAVASRSPLAGVDAATAAGRH